MRVRANDTGFDVDADTDLLTALSQHGVCARYSCRNGSCGLCEAELSSGSVWLDDSRRLVEAPATVLLCRAHARADLTLFVAKPPALVSRYCRVLSVEKQQGWYRVVLQLPAGRLQTLEYGHLLRLEESVSARDVSIVRLPSLSAPRELEIWLNDEDHAWLAAIETGALRIQLPVVAVLDAGG